MAENKQITDNELMLQIVGYNSEAFEQLFNRYSTNIYSLIKEIVSNPKLSEKILLNTFSVFLKRIDFYDTTSNNIFTHLTLLARNISLDVFKRMKFVEDIPIYSDDYEIEYILPNLSQEITVINLDERELFGEKIKSYRSQLNEVQNLLLSLVYFEGLNEEEIAKRLNVPMITVRQKISAIMESLHKQYVDSNTELKGNREILELIKLEALGFLSSEEKMLLMNLKENDPDFLWKELGEYQNLTALISTTISLQPLPRQLDEEVKNIFTQILLQGGDVEYPVVASEIPIIEPIVATTKTQPIEEKPIIPEPTVEKDNGFHLKFREPDPTELNILKKIEIAESNHKVETVLSKSVTSVQAKQNKPEEKRIPVASNKIESKLDDKAIIQSVLKDDKISQNKTSIPELIKTNVDIENDDPLIIIDEPAPPIVKSDNKIVSRLTPTSSISIDDIIRKNPLTELNKKTVEVSKPVEKTVPVKEPEKQVVNVNIDAKTSIPEAPKEILPSKPVAVKVEQPVVAKVVEPVKTNAPIEQKVIPQPQKEIKKEVPVVENKDKQSIEELVKKTEEKFEIKIKTNEPPREIKPSSTTLAKVETPATQVVQEKPVAPPVDKSEIKFRTNLPPKELHKDISAIAESIKANQIRKQNQTVQSPVVKPVTTEIKKEVVHENPVKLPELKPVESKIVETKKDSVPVEKEKVELKSLVDLIQTNKTIVQETKEASSFERIKAADNKSGLKIRETKYAEEESNRKAVIPVVDLPTKEVTPEIGKVITDQEVHESLNLDEILNKIADDKPELKTSTNSSDYETELVLLKKKLRRNILVSAAMFVLLIGSGAFIYFNMQSTPVKGSNVVKKSTTQTANLQANVTVPVENYETTFPEVVIEKPEEKDLLSAEEKVEEKVESKVTIAPLKQNIDKQENSYVSLNEKNDTPLNQKKDVNQTAAAKTENTILPKEEKNETKEPAFFVAVEEMPELVGGIKGLQNKIVYPEIAKRVGIEGKVLVQAIVDENGKVISTSTIKGIGAGCDEVAMDAVRNSKFTPGKQRGKNVKVQVTIPIVFKK